MESRAGDDDGMGVKKRPPKLEPNLTALGAEIRRLRNERDLTQEELADEAGLSSNYLSDVERGRRNITVGAMFAIAGGLGVDPHKLFEAL